MSARHWYGNNFIFTSSYLLYDGKRNPKRPNTTSKKKISLQEVELAISSEVTQAYNNFISQKEKIMHYTDGLTNDAKQIPEGRIYSYQRGENSLIEVIEAQRTYNQIQEGYYETLFGYTAALLELERVLGKNCLIFKSYFSINNF